MASQAPSFSVVLIARNEAKTLPRLMSSLEEFRKRGGEIILVDTGSTDNTAEVARSFGAKVFEEGDRFRVKLSADEVMAINQIVDPTEPKVVELGDSLFDFSSARNYAASLASNDVVAMPDCDEMYTKLGIDAINTAITEAGIEQFEYNFVFSHDAEGNELIKFMHSKFYNRTKLHWEGIIHEILVGEAKRQFFPESFIKLEHWQNHETNRGGYLKGLALDYLRNQENDRHVHYYGRELMYTGRFHTAIKVLHYHIAMNRWPEERAQSMIHIGECYEILKRRDEAIEMYVRAFDTCPTRREGLMKLAELYYKEKRPNEAVVYAAAALQIKGGNFYANFQPYYENLPHEILYWGLWQMGDLRQSKAHLDKCLAYQPHNVKYLHDMRWYYEFPKMSIVLPTLGRPEGLAKALASIDALDWPEDKKEVIVIEDSPRLGVPKRLKEGVEKATGEWIVYASNDIEFAPDALLHAFNQAMSNKSKFIAFNTGDVLPDEGNICEHFMIHKDLIPKIGGEIFDTEFNHVGVDNLLWAKIKKLGYAMRCPRAKVAHHHFSKTGIIDETTKVAWNEESVKKDRELLKKKLAELEA